MSKGIAGRLAALRDSLKAAPSDATADPAGDVDSAALSARTDADAPHTHPEFADSADAIASPQVHSVDSAGTVRTRRRYGSTRVVIRPVTEAAMPISADTATGAQTTHEPGPDTSAADTDTASSSGPVPDAVVTEVTEPHPATADPVVSDAAEPTSGEPDDGVLDDEAAPAETMAADEPVHDEPVHDEPVHDEPAQQSVAEPVGADEPIEAEEATAAGGSDVSTEAAPAAADFADEPEAPLAGEQHAPDVHAADAADQPAAAAPVQTEHTVAAEDVAPAAQLPAETSVFETDAAVDESSDDAPAAAELHDDLPAVDEPSDDVAAADVPAPAELNEDLPAVHESSDDAPAVDQPSDDAPAVHESSDDAPAVGEPEDDVADAVQPGAAASTEDTVTADQVRPTAPRQDDSDDATETSAAVGAGKPVQSGEPVGTDEATAPGPAVVTAAAQPAPGADHPRRTTTVLAGIAAIAAVIVVVVGLALFFGRSSGHKSAGAAATSTGATSGPATASAPTATASNPAPSIPTSSSSDGGSPSLPPQTQLARWAKANLSPAAIIVADASAAKTLRADGFANVVKDTSTSTDWRTVAYLIRGRAGASPSALRVQLAHAAAPLALFGSGAGEVVVSEVHPELGSALAARIKADQKVRHQAGSELVQNSNISFSATAKKTVRAGLLDIRSASFLVQLARTTRVYVIDVVCDSAETRAGRPCRTIVVSTGDMNMLQQTLSASALSYKPISVREIDHDAVRLQWIPAIITVAGG